MAEDGQSQDKPFKPYIPPESGLREFTILPLVTGTLLGIIFGASSLYLVLKVGMTVSASIPVAVISITLFSLLRKAGLRNATILENNIVQTAGSAGESIAFGIGITMPAILILGFDLEITRVLLVGVLGAVLGILMMVPLRRALIVRQHGVLKYPEGTACAEVLKAGASEESRAAASAAHRDGGAGEGTSAGTLFAGFGIAFIYNVLMLALKGWKEVPRYVFGKPFESASVAAEVSPTLLGVGYIIGPRISSIMCAGGVLAYLVLIPAIAFFGGGLAGPLEPGTEPIGKMTPDSIRSAYVLYIGAGAVAAGGLISLVRSLPIIAQGLRRGVGDLRGGRGAAGAPRTDRDLPLGFVIGGIILLTAAILAFRALNMNLLGAALILIVGFLFVTVSSRLTGEIGSSPNPISGMTVATLLLTCLIFLIVGWTGPAYYVTALSVGAIVCIAAGNAGATSQDLKTGFLVGATPRLQQIAILVGALASAVALGPILLKLNDASTVYVPQATGTQVNFPADLRAPASELGAYEKLQGPQAVSDPKTYRVWQKTDSKGGPAGRYLVDESGSAVWLVDPGINGQHKKRPDGSEVAKFDAPKAVLMSYIIKGILNQELPWGLVLLGVMIAIVLEMIGVPSLPFAVGVYLPLSSSTPIFVGGAVRWLVDWRIRRHKANRGLSAEALAAQGDKGRGVLMASGYIAGGAVAGIVIAFMAGALTSVDKVLRDWAEAKNPFFMETHDYKWSNLLALIPFAVLALVLFLVGFFDRISTTKAQKHEAV
ncbi:MAG: OPT family oligopeptide transporter [Phycisphaerae bacterium]